MDCVKQYKKKKVAIIGSGVGGLTLAAKLPKDCFDVTIYEKNKQVGGRCWTFDKDGYKFEQGAILYLFDQVYQYVFKQIDPNFGLEIGFANHHLYHQIFFGDGTVFSYSKGQSALANEINKFEPHSDTEAKLEKFCKECKYLEEFAVENVFKKTYDTVWDLLSFLCDNFFTNCKILWTSIRHTMHSIIGRYFKNDFVCQALTFQSLYFGISPFTGSSLFSILVGYEIATGLKYPLGGMGSIVTSLKEFAENKKNVKIRLNESVSRIVIKGNKATGIILNDKEIQYDIIVSNADLTYTYNVLLKQEGKDYSETERREADKRAAKLAKKNHVPSTITFFWGMNCRFSKLRAQNIFLPKDYKKLFDDIHVHKKIPDDPAFFVLISNHMDQEMTIKSRDALTVIVPVGEMAGAIGGFDKKVEIVKKKVIAKLNKSLGITDFADRICTEAPPETPDTWRDKFNCWDGNILGISHSLNNLLYFRPHQKHEKLSNLYFVGASTQPGAGVPLVMCSALNLASKLEKDFPKTD